MVDSMSDLDLSSSVVDWCIEHPETIAVFEQLGVDYCCGGKSLEYACYQRALDPDEVLVKLQQKIASRQQDQREAMGDRSGSGDGSSPADGES